MAKYISMSVIFFMFYMIGNIIAILNQPEQFALAVECFDQMMDKRVVIAIEFSGSIENQVYQGTFDAFRSHFERNYRRNIPDAPSISMATSFVQFPEYDFVSDFVHSFRDVNNLDTVVNSLRIPAQFDRLTEPLKNFVQHYDPESIDAHYISAVSFCDEYRRGTSLPNGYH